MSVYANESDVLALIKFLDDSPSSDMVDRVIKNAESLVNAKLLEHSIPISNIENTDDFDILESAVVYFAASDIIISLYTGENLPAQYDAYFNKAEYLLDSYILKMEYELAETDLKNKNPVKHRNALTYNERHHRR